MSAYVRTDLLKFIEPTNVWVRSCLLRQALGNWKLLQFFELV